MNIINIEHISKLYQVGTEEVHALRDISIGIDKMSMSLSWVPQVQGNRP
jgi:hypothetical protein